MTTNGIEHLVGCTADPDTHCEVDQVDKRPADLLCHAGDGVNDDLAGKHKYDVD